MGVGIAQQPDVGGRRRAEADVVIQPPVLEIVAALVAGAGEVGDLILPEAVARKEVHGVKVHVRLIVVGGENVGALILVVHGRAFLKTQTVAGDVRGLERERLGERVGPVLARLARQTVDEIETHVAEAGLARALDRHFHLPPVVAAADEPENVVVGALRADGKAVHALLAQHAQLLAPDAVRVALHGDLALLHQPVRDLQLLQYLHDAPRAVVARRAAAEVHRVDKVIGHAGHRFLQLNEQRILVIGHELVPARQTAEVAVRALRCAERYVKIYAQAFVLVAHSSSRMWVVSAGKPLRQNLRFCHLPC